MYICVHTYKIYMCTYINICIYIYIYVFLHTVFVDLYISNSTSHVSLWTQHTITVDERLSLRTSSFFVNRRCFLREG